MNLRVFKGNEDILFAEISTRRNPYSNKVFVPLILAPQLVKPDLSSEDKSAAVVRFKGLRYLGYIYLITSLNIDEAKLTCIGELESEDSINIQNHFFDCSAWNDD